ncbi:hypothetical protein M0802_012129 [Mischocyttarus mexicanus]|nr:hypothetical protein M0802_012129 [Mischocyttarus mexicanus]
MLALITKLGRAVLYAVSARGDSQVLLGEVDIAIKDDHLGVTEITTEEPYLTKCIVDGNAYSHSQTDRSSGDIERLLVPRPISNEKRSKAKAMLQNTTVLFKSNTPMLFNDKPYQIPSQDVNSHCLCVAGEVYCWWQNYNPSTDSSMSLLSTTIGSNYTPMLEVSTDTGENSEASGDHVEEEGLSEQSQGRVDINSTYSTTPSGPTTCLVMGREYREGEVLPHSTGNCVECSCGSEGRVECSPRDCVPLRPEIPVAPDIPEPLGGADFELFDLARDRGIDDGF